MEERLPKNFMDKIDSSGECWLWKASTTMNGYGKFNENKKTYRAHRYCWIKLNGEIPKGMFICHKCDNPLCVKYYLLTFWLFGLCQSA